MLAIEIRRATHGAIGINDRLTVAAGFHLARKRGGDRIGRCIDNEKLTGIRVFAGVCHRECTGIVVQTVGKFVCERAAPDAFTTKPGGSGVAALNDKILDDAMEQHAIVVPLLCKSDKIFDRKGGERRKQDRPESAHAGVKNGDGIAILWRCELKFVAFKLGRTGRSGAAAEHQPRGKQRDNKE
ncbi:hypothetical protein SDC9_104434 [bioreactor metagenome]|uniref:Uncharacterized protein n=1 Tax=bioreactor metagenome TaxID=1076179 RepID=A0A645AWJ1_9ZZZZ